MIEEKVKKIIVMEIELSEQSKKTNTENSFYLYAVFPYPKTKDVKVYLSPTKIEKTEIDNFGEKFLDTDISLIPIEYFNFYSREEIINLFEEYLRKGKIELFDDEYYVKEKKLYKINFNTK